jgi:hypothetical protein
MTEEITVAGYSLPTNLEYKDAIKVELANPTATRISSAALEFHPYLVFEYTLDITRKDPIGGTHPVKDGGIHIVDASKGRFLSPLGRVDVFTPLRVLHRITNVNRTENLDLISRAEIAQTIIDLQRLKTVLNRKIVLNGDYEVGVIDDEVSLKIGERKVLEKIVSENTQKASYYRLNRKGKRKEQKIKIIPRFSEIIIIRKSLIYVPKWIITIKAGECVYNRKALAASNTLIVDDIAFCPNHFTLGKIWSASKRTSAVCEICGGAFCDDHIFKINNTYYCERHKQDPVFSNHSPV